MLKTFLKGNFHSKNNFKKAIKISQIIEIVRRKILENWNEKNYKKHISFITKFRDPKNPKIL